MLVGQRIYRRNPVTREMVLVTESLADNTVRTRPMPRAKAGTTKPAPAPKLADVSPTGFSEGGWDVTAVDVVKGYKIDPPKLGDNGKPITHGRFAIPMMAIQVRRPHWNEGLSLTVRRNTKGQVFILDEHNRPCGNFAGYQTRTTLVRVFGPAMGETISQILNV